MKLKKTAFLAIVTALLFSCNTQKNNINPTVAVKIPTENEVGVKMLSAEIAPVKAPFKTIQFTKPTFPAERVTLTLSATEINTTTIQKAIDALTAKGGGTIVVPNGRWLTGRIQLKDNINFHLESGAQLVFSGEIKDFLPVVFTRIEGIEVMSLGACIYANGATNIAITGNGKLIGPQKGSIRDRILTKDVIDNVIDPNTPVAERIVDGTKQDWIFPPMFISPINCKKVYIEGVSLENSAFWNIVPIYCDNVIIRGITVNSVGTPRGDGIDIESTKNVLIEYCNLSTGDDCFTMKAGRGEDGIRVNKSTENIVVRYCLALKGHGGITCGSETAGMIRNLYVHDCVFKDSGVGIRFKTRRSRGGGGENLIYERIRMNLDQTAIKWDMLGSSGSVGDLAARLPARAINKLTPKFQNITIKDIIVENCTTFIKVFGIPETPVNHLSIENAKVNCDELFDAHDLKNAVFKNISITAKNSTLSFLDSRNILFENIDFKTPSSPNLDVKGTLSDSIIVHSSKNMKDTKWFKK
ncbi:glycoside hydrolase family 28 protein [Flavobacterium seoulense]|uniref:Glycoside hydrolase n=1 Tax=Flavobacterium seoulense TaxID=1492738 RepID=A0A066WK38_9FLAO|nr:glycoside hydrolase family 28 protein [Flavobacterium seoulense]KDN54221.1 glycoside hydrolase [Flavobacterium seoulense]